MDKWHGTSGGYSNHRCRCDLCKSAWNRYSAELKRKRRANFKADGDTVHGLPRTYQKGCTCTECKSAQARYSKEIYAYGKKSKPGKCDICEKHVERLHWDHDHATGRERGWLCVSCNQGLGIFNDDLNFIEKAIAYLKKGVN